MARLLVPAFLAALCCAGTGAVADQNRAGSTIGVRLLEAPANRRDDPRAQTYIVDHLAPGAVIRRRMSITNSSPMPQHIEVFPSAATIEDNAFEAMSGRVASELTGWISVDRAALEVPAWQSAQVLVTIAVAPNAPEGEQYGVVWAQTSAPSATSDNVMMISRVGIRVYLDVGAGGEPPSNFEVGSLTPARTKDGQPEVLADLHNTGGRALDISGELSLSDGPGGVSAGPFPLTVGATVLPDHTAQVRVLMAKGLPDGPWKVRLTLRSGLIERTTTAALTFPSTADTLGAPVTPDSWIAKPLVLLGVLAALGLSFLAARRRLARRPRTSAAGSS